MAARRVASSSVDWAEFARKIPASQKAAFTAFKQKHDGYLRAVNTLPEKSPAIDFNAYKSKIAIAGMVDDFQKKYETLQIPYPKDNVSSEINSQAVQKKAEYEKFVVSSKTKITGIEVELSKWEAMMPVEEMNKEEALATIPHLNLVVNAGKPRFYPGTEDISVWKEYVAKVKAEHAKNPDGAH